MSTVDDPYGDPYGSDPYGAPAAEEAGDGDDEVAGYLGGAPGEEELPALPGQADDGGSYTARDFMDSDETAGDDVYNADPYSTMDVEDYADPYALPPSSSSPYDEYEGYDAAAMAEDDPSYFDSMGHDEADTEQITAPVGYDTEEYEDDDQPKTISQQDAESIIRRITTKRILPPESQQSVTPRPLTASGGGLRIWPILLVVVVLLAGGVYVFRVPIAEKFPQLAGILGVTLEPETEIEKIPQVDPNEVKRKAMIKMVVLSEMKAFGISKEADLLPVQKAAKKTEGGGK